MTVPQRNYQSPAYRYGFQGQEKDDEIKGFGNSLNYKFRMHDPRVGRFFAIDPLDWKYPWNSPYAFSENRVIDGVELEGMEVRSTFSPQTVFNTRKALVATYRGIVRKVKAANKRAAVMSDFYDKNKHVLSENDRIPFGTSQIYFYAYFSEFGSFTDAEDVSVLLEGRTIDGKDAGILDYSLAGVGAFIPFASGGSLKGLFKSSLGEMTERSIKLADGNILNLTTKANKFDGAIKLSDNSGVMFDADFNVSIDGKTLTLENIGFYKHKDGDILGAEAQNSLGKMPFEILSKIKQQAKSEGFETLKIKFKREIYDDAGKFTGKYGEDIIKDIPLNK